MRLSLFLILAIPYILYSQGNLVPLRLKSDISLNGCVSRIVCTFNNDLKNKKLDSFITIENNSIYIDTMYLVKSKTFSITVQVNEFIRCTYLTGNPIGLLKGNNNIEFKCINKCYSNYRTGVYFEKGKSILRRNMPCNNIFITDIKNILYENPEFDLILQFYYVNKKSYKLGMERCNKVIQLLEKFNCRFNIKINKVKDGDLPKYEFDYILFVLDIIPT